MVQPDPYQRWSAAPKHWIEFPVRRQAQDAGAGTPAERRPVRPPPDLRRCLRQPVVVALLVTAAAVLLLTLAGPGTSVAMLDAPTETAP